MQLQASETMKSKSKQFIFVWILFLSHALSHASSDDVYKVVYDFSDEPIDVVIPTTYKDLETLNLCIEGIRNNCSQVRRIIVVSPEPLTDQAEWFDETKYPFSKEEVSFYLNQGDFNRSQEYLADPKSRLGWYYQQLLKFYAPFVIKDISSNVLILDSDTIFLKPVVFTNSQFAGLYTTSVEDNPAYFKHASKLIPGFRQIFQDYSGISHHMLFQRCVLEDLFQVVNSCHQIEFWKAFCLCVDEVDLVFAGASEYEIYFNFLFSRTSQAEIRQLKQRNIRSVQALDYFRSCDFDYVSCHSWSRQ